MDITTSAIAAAILAGITELITRLRGRDYWVAATIIVCAVAGGLLGAFHLANVPDVITGILYGFGTSGAVSFVGSVGNKSGTTPSNIVK